MRHSYKARNKKIFFYFMFATMCTFFLGNTGNDSCCKFPNVFPNVLEKNDCINKKSFLDFLQRGKEKRCKKEKIVMTPNVKMSCKSFKW